MDKIIYEVFEQYINNKFINAVISNSTEPTMIKKIHIRPIMIKGNPNYQLTEYKGKQVFHTNLSRDELTAMLPKWFEGLFKQVQISAQDKEVTILVSRKGKAAVKEKKRALSISPDMEHNRKKNYIINEGDRVPFLIDLGIMTEEGRIVKTRYDKFRQINRYLEIIEDIIDSLPDKKEMNIVDFGCGKSYLTFAMYYYLNEIKNYSINITGLDLKEEVIENCSRLKEAYGYDKLKFLCGDIADYESEEGVDMVVSLHACDTATDYAIYKAVNWGASVILAVPCCQHEVNKSINSDAMNPVMKHGLIKERMSALITDALRSECLEIMGYKTQVMEFIDMEHTPKNILIRAVKNTSIIPYKVKEEKKKEMFKYIKAMNVNLTLVNLIQ